MDSQPVERAEVAEHPDGSSKGFGTVRLPTPHAAAYAIRILNGTMLRCRVILVRYDRRAL